MAGTIAGVFLFLGLCLSLLFNLVLVAAGAGGISHGVPVRAQEGVEKVIMDGGGSEDGGYVAVIPIEGVIQTGEGGEIGQSMVDDAKIAMRAAGDDDSIRAVVLAVDSPGGEVTASDILYSEVSRLSGKKPVVVSMGATGASGAYYMACGADYIMANDTTFTGSIGVIIHSMNYGQLLGKVGLSPMVFKSGKFKDMLSGAREPTREEKDYVQGIVGQVYDKFLGIVSRSRELPEGRLREGVADGRILTGKDAKAAGLVDGLGYLEDAIAKARELSGASGAGVVRYRPEASLKRILRQIGAQATAGKKVEINLGGDGFSPRPGVAYYLPDIFLR